MRFLTLFWPDMSHASASPAASGGPSSAMLEYSRRSSEAGTLVSQGMFGSMATEIALSDGKYTTTERSGEPFGFAYLEAASPAEAVEHVKEFLSIAGGGKTLIRQIADGEPSRA